jgi:hypothetical protein
MPPVTVCTILTKCLASFYRDELFQILASACSDSAETFNTLSISIAFIYILPHIVSSLYMMYVN